MLIVLYQILDLFTQIFITVIIVQFILSMLVMFNVVSISNQYVSAIMQALNAILDPFLRPIRKFLPDTGMIDFSPIVLIFAIKVIMIILASIATSSGAV